MFVSYISLIAEKFGMLGIFILQALITPVNAYLDQCIVSSHGFFDGGIKMAVSSHGLIQP